MTTKKNPRFLSKPEMKSLNGWAVWGWDEGFGLDRQNSNGSVEVDTTVAAALG